MIIDNIFFNLIFYLISFLVVFLIDYFIINKEKKGRKKIEKMTSEGMFLIKRFDLDDKKINLTKLNFHIAIINAFIISTVTLIVCLTSLKIPFKLAIAFVLLFGLIYSIYEIYGRRIRKIWGKDRNNK